MKSILITSDRSGSGKTSITLAIAAILSKKKVVQTFKVGMDYIDPSYLSAASHRPCRNFDSFTLTRDQMEEIFSHGCSGADCAIVEGVRGLFEGAEATSDIGSTAAIAKQFDLPVVLIVSARSITRSAAAIVRGFQAFDDNVRIAGVILNNVKGASHTEKATTAIEQYCRVPVIGAIPRLEEMHLAMRHLGLVPYREGSAQRDFHNRIAGITGIIEEYVDIEAFESLMKEIPAPSTQSNLFEPAAQHDVRIGMALDEVFNFYYSDLFDTLSSLGADIVPFSPIHDRLPDADGYMIGGGYPELFVRGLEDNNTMREGIREQSRNGIPVYAECGGLMYLTGNINLMKGWQGLENDTSFEMCGIFSGATRMPARRVVSYVEGTSDPASPVGAAWFRGHEFHYSHVILDKDTRYAYTLSRGVGIRDNLDGAVVNNTLGSYTHLHPVASRKMLQNFVGCCRKSG